MKASRICYDTKSYLGGYHIDPMCLSTIVPRLDRERLPRNAIFQLFGRCDDHRHCVRRRRRSREYLPDGKTDMSDHYASGRILRVQGGRFHGVRHSHIIRRASKPNRDPGRMRHGPTRPWLPLRSGWSGPHVARTPTLTRQPPSLSRQLRLSGRAARACNLAASP
jgi:hypothetical protein